MHRNWDNRKIVVPFEHLFIYVLKLAYRIAVLSSHRFGMRSCRCSSPFFHSIQPLHCITISITIHYVFYALVLLGSKDCHHIEVDWRYGNFLTPPMNFPSNSALNSIKAQKV